MIELTQEQVRLVLAVSRQGPDSVPRILRQLDPEEPDCVPLMMALGEIGSPGACGRLEEIAGTFGADDPKGLTARKALTLCGGEATTRFALEALGHSSPEVVELGFWMVKHGRLRSCHEQVADAASRLAEEGLLEGTAFLETAAVSQCSASEASWSALDVACRRVLSAQHTVWLYRPLIRSGLPQACVLLLELAARLWTDHRKRVNGITYALWALAEEPVSCEQVVAVDEWLKQGADVAGLSDAMAAVSVDDAWGHALTVAARLGLPGINDMFGQTLGDEEARWRAHGLVGLAPQAATVRDLRSAARDQQGNMVLSNDCARALAAQGTAGAFDALVTAICEWETLPRDVAYAFAPAALRSSRVDDCRTWLADAAEGKCLRQASALAVGLAIHHTKGTQDVAQLVSALESALSDEDVAYAAVMGCSMAQVEGLLPRLQEIVEAGGPIASEAAFSVVNIGTDDALGFLYGICDSRGPSYLKWSPAEALAKSLKDRFAEPSNRCGVHWERARDWLVDTYKCFSQDKGSGGLWTGLVVASALLDCAVEWGLDSLAPTIEAQVLSDPSPGSISSSVIHQRWRLLAHHRPAALLGAAKRYAADQVSDSNKPHLARALLEVRDQTEEVRDLVLVMAREAKTLARREMALAMATCEPGWLSEIPPCAANAPLLRDIAVFAEQVVADAITARLLADPSGRLRRYGHQAVAGRERQHQALRVLEVFRGEAVPARRLWWVQSFVALADEKALVALDRLRLPTEDLSHEYAARHMRDEARKRLEKEARDEDSSLERDSTPWVW